MSILTGVTARILFSIPFLAFGIRYLMHANQMAASYTIPGGVIWVYLTGIIFILAGIAAITKFQGKSLMILVALWLIIFAFILHLPGMTGSDATLKMAGEVNFYKDLGLAGGALILAGLFGNEKKTAA